MRPLSYASMLLALASFAGGVVSAQPKGGGGIVRPLPPKAKMPGAVIRRPPNEKQVKRLAEFERLDRMSPEQRRKALDRLPVERRQRIEEGLAQYRNMNPENRERLRNFQKLPEEQRDSIRQNFRRMQELPQERRVLVRRELQQLRSLTPEERETRFQSEGFKKRFDTNEQSLIRDTIVNLPQPE
jgi:hypothetical protein